MLGVLLLTVSLGSARRTHASSLSTTTESGAWYPLRSCPLRGRFYQCSGDKYEEHLANHTPPLLTSRIPADAHVLFFGPSYLRQLFLETICVHWSDGYVDEREVKNFVDGSPLDDVRTIRLKNNATITSVINAAPYQNSTSSSALYGLLEQFQFTHAFYMDTHSDCFFRRELCIPTGDGLVRDRAPTAAEVAQQCVLRRVFSQYFAPRHNRSWLHVLSWCGLWSTANNIDKDFDLCKDDDAETRAGSIVDTTELMQRAVTDGRGVCQQYSRKSTELGTCNSIPYGHMCSPGWITDVSLDVWNLVFGNDLDNERL